jgi:hypothetical protein
MIVEINFNDHVENSEDMFTFLVWGRVCEVHRKFVVIEMWAYPDQTATRDQNVKTWVILKATINSWRELV